jgi:hypothetical protein
MEKKETSLCGTFLFSRVFVSWIQLTLLTMVSHSFPHCACSADVLSGSTSSSVHHSGVLEEWAGAQTWWNGREIVMLFTILIVLLPLSLLRRVGMYCPSCLTYFLYKVYHWEALPHLIYKGTKRCIRIQSKLQFASTWNAQAQHSKMNGNASPLVTVYTIKGKEASVESYVDCGSRFKGMWLDICTCFTNLIKWLLMVNIWKKLSRFCTLYSVQ